MVLFLRYKKSFCYIPDNDIKQDILGWNTSIVNCGRYYILLLLTTQGAKRQVFPIYLSTLTSFLMFPFSLLIVLLSCISSLGILMMFTPTTNQGSLIYRWRSSGLISVVGCGYVCQLLCEWLLLISINYFVVGLIDITMKIHWYQRILGKTCSRLLQQSSFR